MSSTAHDERTGRDRCPGVLELHEAADGWLARVRLPGGRLRADQMRALAAAAAQLGNGLIDVTTRANLQLRGLDGAAGGGLAALLSAAALLPSRTHDRVRNIVAAPLAGRAPGSLDAIDDVVALLDERLCAQPALAELPGRFCFLVDDGSAIGAALDPDVSLLARGAGRFGLALDGLALDVEDDAAAIVALALDAALAFVALRGDAWRLSETPGGPRSIAKRLGRRLATVRPLARRPRALRPGIVEQRDGRVALTALAPFGQLTPPALLALAEIDADVRLAARRTLTVVDVPPAAVVATRAAMHDAGLVVDGASGWVGLTACAGSGACPRALDDVRAAAAARALVREPSAPAEHWAGCERRCGETRDTPVTVAVQRASTIAVRWGAQEWSVRSLDGAAAMLAEAAR